MLIAGFRIFRYQGTIHPAVRGIFEFSLHDQTNDPNVARYDKKTILNCQIPALKIHENPTCNPKILILPI